ncbi:hypothetical protein IFM89_032538 [Coptis chinensis]|uniref:Transcription repressor n=1 Tax=Coptis chinensis TaxID=261450 RepID=A0A835IS78_9MAGN|nr:hypothetical protein IFM89_032538 [Coptis chinensis]
MVHTAPKPKRKMPRILGKTVHFCFSKTKSTNPTQFSQTPSTQNDQKCPSHTSTSSKNIIPHKLKHIPTIYDLPSYSPASISFTPCTSEIFSSNSDSDSHITSKPPDFSTILASQRFFIASPGHSNSIVDSTDSNYLPEPEALIAGGIPIRTHSPNPYIDFRESMVEMVEARELFDVRGDWDGLHELLLCYLALNPKDTHKCIIAAFTDVLISLTSKESHPSHRKSDVSDYYSVARH